MTIKNKSTNLKLKGKLFTGLVVSDKMADTIVVSISQKYRHPLYKKIINKKHKIYSQNNLKANLGDTVQVVETKPISKTKRFKTLKIIKKA